MGELFVPLEKVNQVHAFHAYCLVGGDAKRCALLCRTSPSIIESLAHDFNWSAQLSGLARADTDEGLVEQRALHRLSVFMVSERAKKIFQNIFMALEDDPAFARSFCTQIDPETEEVTFNGKALLDLVKGFETLANISYRALGDKIAQNADVTGNTEDPAKYSITVYQALVNRFDKNATVDTVSEVARALKDVTPSKNAGQPATL